MRRMCQTMHCRKVAMNTQIKYSKEQKKKKDMLSWCRRRCVMIAPSRSSSFTCSVLMLQC